MDADRTNLLARSRAGTRLPAQDLARARRYYAEQLGLEPVDEAPGGLRFRCGGAEFQLFQSAGASPGTFTQMSWEVDDIEAVVAELERRGVIFEEVSLLEVYGGGRTTAAIADVDGYLSTGSRGPKRARGAWFLDSEGNMLGLVSVLSRGTDDGTSHA
jgi:catechol 2,3-dioxygenase-like lactoylglutathione lyase family enzyme